MPVPWFSVLAALAVASGILCALVVALDIAVLGHRQRMRVMELVWPITALYSGPIGLAAYRAWGRQPRHGEQPMPAAVALAVTHCGAGCTLGDIVGSSLVYLAGLAIAGLALWAELPVDYALAFTVGIAFQYAAIASMRRLSRRDTLAAALKADTLSLTAFEIGMFGWMLLTQLVLFPVNHLHPDSVEFWFMMQVAMLLGFATAYPVNWWLVARGIKERM